MPSLFNLIARICAASVRSSRRSEKMSMEIFQRSNNALLEPGGLNVASLRSLVVLTELPTAELFGILRDASHLELVLRGNGVLADLLGIVESPHIQQLSIEGFWNDLHLRSLLAFAMACKELSHLYIYDFAHKTPSTEDIASLLHALPKLEYLDPEWGDSNLEGLLALCGEFSNYSLEDTSQWACPNLPRLSLPLNHWHQHRLSSREQLSRCLGRILDVRCQPNRITVETQGAKLSLVVDMDTETMVSIVGEKWLACGGEYVASLEFPQELRPSQ
ncbi:hypothetical protein DL93DRAFT_2169900 [Clavulina sp. PMI_390]|nr:hypothetical protein DL93DRAFT_2169900 [Clavulina sp. PMI_390]